MAKIAEYFENVTTVASMKNLRFWLIFFSSVLCGTLNPAHFSQYW